ncbi:hypothetical protein HPB51_003271 [Rhipicephalus microplus]|uniref:Uncharacterized protein n=1 Tax=Rhipicephalus microplus TaxID=6941 RepID=A0A9J6EW86_RHIMP|nr:hypothetical protein HPB51_003271 [Rhipicephalus microplus]
MRNRLAFRFGQRGEGRAVSRQGQRKRSGASGHCDANKNANTSPRLGRRADDPVDGTEQHQRAVLFGVASVVTDNASDRLLRTALASVTEKGDERSPRRPEPDAGGGSQKPRDFNLNKAEQMLRAHVEWRKQFGTDDVMTWPESPEVGKAIFLQQRQFRLTFGVAFRTPPPRRGGLVAKGATESGRVARRLRNFPMFLVDCRIYRGKRFSPSIDGSFKDFPDTKFCQVGPLFSHLLALLFHHESKNAKSSVSAHDAIGRPLPRWGLQA